jgi:acyl-CoA thioesterase-2
MSNPSSNPPIDLVSLLDLETLEDNLFRGVSPPSRWPRVFGGQVIGQAMVAACRTVEGRLPHSLHAYFILPGDPSVPIIYEVGRLRDGRSFTTRRITAIQHGAAIFSMIVSFAAAEGDSFAHQEPMPDVPSPDALSPEKMRDNRLIQSAPRYAKRFFGDEAAKKSPVLMRPVEFERYFGKKIENGRINMWTRTSADLPDDPAIHLCALGYLSDMALLDTVAARYGQTFFQDNIMAASLDHAMWFHRPFRADEWLLYSQESPNANSGRGLARGLVFRQDGTLVASVAQEGLVRFRGQRPAPQEGPEPLGMP